MKFDLTHELALVLCQAVRYGALLLLVIVLMKLNRNCDRLCELKSISVLSGSGQKVLLCRRRDSKKAIYF